MSTNDRKNESAQSAAAGAAQVQCQRGQEAMKMAMEGGQRLKEVAAQYANASHPNHVAGRLFEELHAATGNMDAALKGLPQRFFTTASAGQPHAPADIAVKLGGKVVAEAQAKLSPSSTHLVRRLSEPLYDGMQKLVPEGMSDKVKDIAGALGEAGRRPDLSLKDTAAKVSERIAFGGAKSKPVSVKVAQEAAARPAEAARALEMDALKGACGSAAAMSGVTSGVMTAIQGGSMGEVAKASATGAAKGVVQQLATKGVEKVGTMALSQVSSKAANAFSRGGAAGAIAGAGIGVAGDLVELAKGEIDGKECAVRAGKHAARAGGAWAGAEAGAALGVCVGGPIGAAIGGLVGGMLGSMAPDMVLRFW